MNKGLIALGIGAVVGIAAIIFSERSKKRSYHEMKSSDDTMKKEEKVKQNKKFSDRIKRAATDKVVDILGFVAKHEKETKSITMSLCFASAILEFFYRAMRIGTMRDLNKKMDALTDLVKGNLMGTFYLADEMKKLKKAVHA